MRTLDLNLEQVSIEFNLDKTTDLNKFKATYLDNFDFDKVREFARTYQVKRTGSRSLSWKMMLGVLPAVNDQEKWIATLKEDRFRFLQLEQQYLSLFAQTKAHNPLSSLKNNCKATNTTIMKEDRDLMNLISRDVVRTMQEFLLFKSLQFQSNMTEILFIWAKENPEYKYQQGMNDILAIIIIALISEQADLQEMREHSDNFNIDSEDNSNQTSSERIFLNLHDSEHVWADAYHMFSNLMGMGLKKLYYRDAINRALEILPPTKKNDSEKYHSLNSQISLETHHSNRSNMSFDQEEEDERQKKRKMLELQIEEQRNTQLRKRANKIFNVYLKQIDYDLYKHLSDYEIEPELIMLKWLRCLFARDFSLKSILSIWDFVLSGISEEERYNQTQVTTSYEDNHHQLINIDYICLALLQYQKTEFLTSDYIECLNIVSNPIRHEGAENILKLAKRIEQIITERFTQDSLLLSESKLRFPCQIEKQAFDFMIHHQMYFNDGDSNSHYLGEGSQSTMSLRNFFSVREENNEEDEEDSEDQDCKMKSEVINQTCDQDTIENESQNPHEIEMSASASPKYENDSITQGNQSIKFLSCEKTNTFKIKDTKGKVVYDQITKQKRYLSPLDQFIEEQEEIFKKNELTSNKGEEQAYEVQTTQASSVHNQQSDMQVIAASSHQEQLNKLSRVARNIELDQKVIQAEALIMAQREESINKLRAIKDYLQGLKASYSGQNYRQVQVKTSKKWFFF